MAKTLCYALLACLLLAPLTAVSGTILVLGDSISAAYGMPVKSGWVNLLRQRLEEERHDYEVVNASISGDTTAGGLKRLPALLEEHSPDKVIVELGGNDGLRGISPRQVEQNLTEIVRLSRDAGAAVVLVSIDLPSSYGIIFNRRFSMAFDNVEDELDVPRVALGYKLLNDRNLIQSDGIHPTAEAQPIILDQIWPAIVGDE